MCGMEAVRFITFEQQPRTAWPLVIGEEEVPSPLGKDARLRRIRIPLSTPLRSTITARILYAALAASTLARSRAATIAA